MPPVSSAPPTPRPPGCLPMPPHEPRLSPPSSGARKNALAVGPRYPVCEDLAEVRDDRARDTDPVQDALIFTERWRRSEQGECSTSRRQGVGVFFSENSGEVGWSGRMDAEDPNGPCSAGPGPTTPRFTAMNVNCRPTPTAPTNPPRPSAYLSGAAMSGTAAPSLFGLPTKTETGKLGPAVGVEKVPDPSGTSDECFFRTRVVGQGERRDPSLDRRQRRGPPCFNDGRPWPPSSTLTRPGDGLVARPRPGTGRWRRRFEPLRSDAAGPVPLGVTVVLDSRWRLLFPYGIRVDRGPEFGIRLTAVAAPTEGLAAALTRCYRW